MSYPPPPGKDQNNPYGQQPPQAPQQQPQQPYGYPQQGQAPQQGGQPGYGYPQQGQNPYAQQPPAGAQNPYAQQPPAGAVPGQPSYGYPQQPAPGTVQAHNGFIHIGPLGPVQLATMGQRFLARLIDSVILGVIMGIVMAAGFASLFSSASSIQDCGSYMDPGYQQCVNQAQSDSMGAMGGFFVTLGLLSLLMLLYEWVMISFKGATVGKMAMGLRVVKEADGSFPGAGGGFIRYIIPVVGSFLCGIGQLLVYLSPFFDNSGKLQGWHDRAAGTVVIKK